MQQSLQELHICSRTCRSCVLYYMQQVLQELRICSRAFCKLSIAPKGPPAQPRAVQASQPSEVRGAARRPERNHANGFRLTTNKSGDPNFACILIRRPPMEHVFYD